MEKRVAIAGDLSFLSLGEIFQLLGSNQSTGVLRVISLYADEPGTIFFKNGSPHDASCGGLKGLDAIYALFGWTKGEYEFTIESVENKDAIKKSQMEIILEGSKMLDDGLIEELGILNKQTPGYVEKSGTLPVIRGPLVDYMYVVDEEDFSNAETIIKQGKHGNWNWVVLDGVVEIRKETPSGQIPINRVGLGAFVGSIAGLLLQSNVRSATVVSVGNVQLGVLDSQRLAMEYSCLTSDFKEIIISLDKRIKQVTNRTVEVMSKKKNTFSELIKDKKIFIRQGDNEDCAYTIDQGSAYIVKGTDQEPFLLNTLEEGDFIGNIPFFHFGHEPNGANVYVTDDFTVNPLNREQIQSEFDRLSLTFKNMIRNSSNILAATTKTISDFKIQK